MKGHVGSTLTRLSKKREREPDGKTEIVCGKGREGRKKTKLGQSEDWNAYAARSRKLRDFLEYRGCSSPESLSSMCAGSRLGTGRDGVAQIAIRLGVKKEYVLNRELPFARWGYEVIERERAR